jgi:hypothetical protein
MELAAIKRQVPPKADHAGVGAAQRGLVGLAQQGRKHMAVVQVVAITGTVQVGGHHADVPPRPCWALMALHNVMPAILAME